MAKRNRDILETIHGDIHKLGEGLEIVVRNQVPAQLQAQAHFTVGLRQMALMAAVQTWHEMSPRDNEEDTMKTAARFLKFLEEGK